MARTKNNQENEEIKENVEETTEIAENIYKISLKRAEELKAIGVVD